MTGSAVPSVIAPLFAIVPVAARMNGIHAPG
jgi:hypothetical protein